MRVDSQHLRHHATEILKVKADPTPWVWIAATGFSAFVPLLMGILRGEGSLAIFGSLTGYFIGLTDHRGTLAHRLLVACVSAATCWVAFFAGVLLQNNNMAFVALSGVMVYLVGIFGGRGAELERLLLFAGIDFFVSRYATSLTVSAMPAISLYFVAALATCLTIILVSGLTTRKTSSEYTTIAQAFRNFFTRDLSRHFYAFTYASAILVAIACVDEFKIERGYWTVVTVLLMMKPDRKESLYRIAQRVFGTLLGISFGEILILCQPPLFLLLVSASVCAALVPYVWRRNYWLVSFAATGFVISLLSVAQYGHVDPYMTLIRLKATLIGCLISAFVICFFRFIEQIFLGASQPI